MTMVSIPPTLTFPPMYAQNGPDMEKAYWVLFMSVVAFTPLKVFATHFLKAKYLLSTGKQNVFAMHHLQ